VTADRDEGMDPIALYDFLRCAALAADEADAGRIPDAETAWQEASFAASGLFAPGSDAHAAVSVILDAASPACGGRGRAALWNALNAASLAVLAVTAQQRELASVIWPDALAATDQLGHAGQMAVLTLPAGARDMAGVTA
jgi:hypothetical protein